MDRSRINISTQSDKPPIHIELIIKKKHSKKVTDRNRATLADKHPHTLRLINIIDIETHRHKMFYHRL